MQLTYRFATVSDAAWLAVQNRHLIEDEQHDNPMSVDELEARMRGWLDYGYRGVIFSDGVQPVAYAIFRRDGAGVYIRHFFVVRSRRREGIGRAAFNILQTEIFATVGRIRLEVLARNERARAFWKAVGFRTHSLMLELNHRRD